MIPSNFKATLDLCADSFPKKWAISNPAGEGNKNKNPPKKRSLNPNQNISTLLIRYKTKRLAMLLRYLRHKFINFTVWLLRKYQMCVSGVNICQPDSDVLQWSHGHGLATCALGQWLMLVWSFFWGSILVQHIGHLMDIDSSYYYVLNWTRIKPFYFSCNPTWTSQTQTPGMKRFPWASTVKKQRRRYRIPSTLLLIRCWR